MTVIVLEITGHDDALTHRVLKDFPATIGRGYDNDVILSDPHVEAHAARLAVETDSQWRIETKAGMKAVKSGDAIRLGGVTLRFFAPSHPVPPAQAMEVAGSRLLPLADAPRPWLLFVIALCVAALWTYAGTWSADPGLAMLAASAAAAACIFIWAGIWAGVGRLIRHKSMFTGHVALASLCVVLSCAAWWTGAAAAFLASENDASSVFFSMLDAATLAFLIYGALAFSTRLTQRARLKAACFFSFGLVLGVFILGTLSAQKFTPDPQYPWRLMPALAAFAPVTPVEDFMKGNKDLFGSDDLKDD